MKLGNVNITDIHDSEGLNKVITFKKNTRVNVLDNISKKDAERFKSSFPKK